MANFIGKILSWIIPPLVGLLYDKIFASIRGYFERKNAEKMAVAKNAAAADQLAAALSAKERDEAAKAVINNL